MTLRNLKRIVMIDKYEYVSSDNEIFTPDEWRAYIDNVWKNKDGAKEKKFQLT